MRSNPIRVAIASCALDTTIRTETLNREGELTLFSMEIWFYDCTAAFAFAFAFGLTLLLLSHIHKSTPHTLVCFLWCRNLINTYRIDEILPLAAFCPCLYLCCSCCSTIMFSFLSLSLLSFDLLLSPSFSQCIAIEQFAFDFGTRAFWHGLPRCENAAFLTLTGVQ